MANLPYRCPNCEKEYNALDMLSLDTNDEKIPICDICSTELELDERTSNNTGMSEKFTKYEGLVIARNVHKRFTYCLAL